MPTNILETTLESVADFFKAALENSGYTGQNAIPVLLQRETVSQAPCVILYIDSAQPQGAAPEKSVSPADPKKQVLSRLFKIQGSAEIYSETDPLLPLEIAFLFSGLHGGAQQAKIASGQFGILGFNEIRETHLIDAERKTFFYGARGLFEFNAILKREISAAAAVCEIDETTLVITPVRGSGFASYYKESFDAFVKAGESEPVNPKILGLKIRLVPLGGNSMDAILYSRDQDFLAGLDSIIINGRKSSAAGAIMQIPPDIYERPFTFSAAYSSIGESYTISLPSRLPEIKIELRN